MGGGRNNRECDEGGSRGRGRRMEDPEGEGGGWRNQREEGDGGCTCTVAFAAQVILPRAGPPHRKQYWYANLLYCIEWERRGTRGRGGGPYGRGLEGGGRGHDS